MRSEIKTTGVCLFISLNRIKFLRPSRTDRERNIFWRLKRHPMVGQFKMDTDAWVLTLKKMKYGVPTVRTCRHRSPEFNSCIHKLQRQLIGVCLLTFAVDQSIKIDSPLRVGFFFSRKSELVFGIIIPLLYVCFYRIKTILPTYIIF